MTDERWDDPGRAPDETMPGRRGFLATLLALGTAGLAGTPLPVAVAKKKRKRCKKKTCPPPDPPQSCVGLCDAICAFCYRRNAADNLCGDGPLQVPVACAPCLSDNDCLGTNHPYCISGRTTPSSGEFEEFACPGQPVGFCANLPPCEP